LWENFLISERIKFLHYHKLYHNYYFWRTKQQQEIDWVEEHNLKISAFEFKWQNGKRAKIPEKFIKNYNADVQVIDRINFSDFNSSVTDNLFMILKIVTV
jgi:predicted AAA+ superfamily ATPase